jgi:hypothetical protein
MKWILVSISVVNGGHQIAFCPWVFNQKADCQALADSIGNYVKNNARAIGSLGTVQCWSVK